MRRALIVVLLVVALVALDAVFNDARVSGALYREVMEFGRILNRTVSELF
jgi:hypothetical protein